MKHTRKKVITVESRSKTVITRRRVRLHFRCDVCGSESVSVLPEGEGLDQLESRLSSSVCADDVCRKLLEGETLPKI